MSGPAARRALAAPLALVAGCGGGAEPAPRASATPAAPVQRVEPTNEELIGDLLRDRAAALEAGDTRAYAATAGGTQPRRDRASGRRARLPLRDVSIDLETLDVRGGRATARVTTSYSIAGIRGDFQAERRVTAVRAGGRWRVGRMAGGRGVPPWEVGEFVARRTPHFVLLAPAGLDVGDLPEALEAGYATMQDLLVRGLRRRYLVVVAADALQARALTIEIRGIETLAAISDASVIQEGPAERTERVASLRLLVVWPVFALLGSEERRRVITHELTHAALTGRTSGRTPSWLSEGVALYVSGDRRLAPPGADLAALSSTDAIGRLTGTAQSDAYAASSAAAFAIAERFGHRRLLALYDVFNDPSLTGRPGRRLAGRAVQRVLGISLGDVIS